MLPVSGAGRQGFVRIVNWSDAPGSVRIRGVRDSGRGTDAITLALDAGAAAHFNSGDLEYGNDAKGLSGGIGRGDGDWRLELQSELDVEALAYIRTADGFVTGMHDLAVKVEGIVDVPFFNPASNANQESRLRLVNPGADDAVVTISGWDDAGTAPSYGAVRVTLRAGDARTVTARQLEAGATGLRGRFGDGIGKWRLSVASAATHRGDEPAAEPDRQPDQPLLAGWRGAGVGIRARSRLNEHSLWGGASMLMELVGDRFEATAAGGFQREAGPLWTARPVGHPRIGCACGWAGMFLAQQENKCRRLR